jgi:hypothetical protein
VIPTSASNIKKYLKNLETFRAPWIPTSTEREAIDLFKDLKFKPPMCVIRSKIDDAGIMFSPGEFQRWYRKIKGASQHLNEPPEGYHQW